MGRRWTKEEVEILTTMAQQYPLPILAEKMDRTVGGVVFKAHTLKICLRHRGPKAARTAVTPDPGAAGFALNEADMKPEVRE